MTTATATYLDVPTARRLFRVLSDLANPMRLIPGLTVAADAGVLTEP